MKSKIVYKKIFSIRVIVAIVMILFVVVSFPWVQKMEFTFARKELNIDQKLVKLWHIETFEGGSMSRSAFLQKCAVLYEKNHKGLLIYIDTLTIEQAVHKLEQGERPDIVSFGYGVGSMFVDLAQECTCTVDIRSELIDSGTINGRVYAVPYMIGGYVKISSGGGECVTSRDVEPDRLSCEAQVLDRSSYEVYSDFVKGKYSSIIGTQRDLIRINNRIEKGNMSNCTFDYLHGYTDLVQYLCVTTDNMVTASSCMDFIEHMISEGIQSRLVSIGMYSVRQQSIYTTEPYVSMERALFQDICVPGAFGSRQ